MTEGFFDEPYSQDDPNNIQDLGMVPEDLREGRSREIARWADQAMYLAEPVPTSPQVTLISMTPDPLRVMAAACELYKGRVVDTPGIVSYETAMTWLTDMTKTKLNAGLEFINLHFLLEGVTRGFTHQLVRQRTACYVQESTRFAVKAGAASSVVMPPSIAAMKEDDPARIIWGKAVESMGSSYEALIDTGRVPAEDARGLLPTNIATRVHYHTNLRALTDHAGMRLCSQAQFEWKQVWAGIINAVMAYGSAEDRWQQKAIVHTLFKPVCYQTGRCEFMAATDRACVIRDRVQRHAAKGESPDQWTDIDPQEPVREGAARVR